MSKIKLTWEYRDTCDSEFYDARHGFYRIQVQDCDGDFSRWHIQKGENMVAMGEADTEDHAVDAKLLAENVLSHIIRADEYNDFIRREALKGK